MPTTSLSSPVPSDDLGGTVAPPRTPDFYAHPVRPPSTAEVVGRMIEVTWPDGSHLRTADTWLWETSVGVGVDPATREGVIDPADLPLDLAARSIRIDDDGHLTLSWLDHAAAPADGTRIHSGWLHMVATAGHRPDSDLPAPEPWTPADLPEPPTRRAGDDPRPFLDDLCRFGLARLTGAGTGLDDLLVVADRIGPPRPTNFGTIWDVRADIEHDGDATTNSTANTRSRLGPHTDLPTREIPPGFQFLHCIENSVDGGYSTMTDGLALVDHLREHEPAHHDALTTLRWVFMNRGRGIDHRWSGPVVEGGADGQPLTIRAFYPVRGFPDMDPDDLPRAYAAMACFSRLAADPAFQLRFPFRPGDVVAFDNRRILHGRDAFTSGGRRHLRGIYLERDDVLSTLRASSRSTHPA